MKEINLKVTPITCMGCVSEIELALNVEGVERVECKARNENVKIIYDENKITVEKIKELIRKIGKEVK